MQVNLLIPAIIVNLITLFLFLKSNLHDRCLLLIIIIGQLILISGEISKNRMKIQISHFFYALTLITGSVYFNEFHNKLFILICLFVTIITRKLFSGCLFDMSSNYYQFEIEEYIDLDWGIIYMIIFLITIYRTIYK